ncbi:MAG: DUF6056 family protein [Microgenomates group bacterium]
MKKISWYILIPILVLSLVASMYVITTSSLVRFWADDFCSSVLLRNNGYWQSQIIWWKGWTGRYSYIAFLDLVELFGLMGAQILPIVLFVLFIVSFCLIFGLQISLLLSVIFLINSPNIIQSFYWMTGSLNYFAPFIFLNFYLALLFRKNNQSLPLRGKKYINLIGFILLFIAAGFSESFAVATFVFLVFLLFVLNGYKKEKIILTGLAAIGISLVFMYLAPGNAARSATVSHPDGLMDLITKTFSYSKWYLIHLLYIKEFILSVVTIIVSAFVFCNTKIKYFENPKSVILYSMTFIIGITFVVVGLTYQAMNWEPPMRVMTIVNYMILYALIPFSIALSQIYSKYLALSIPKFILVVTVLMLIFQTNKLWGGVYEELRTYANGWDAIETKLINVSDGAEVEVPELKPVGKLDGFVENKGWVLGCIKGYYDTSEIIVK